jgi:hypothetical protein
MRGERCRGSILEDADGGRGETQYGCDRKHCNNKSRGSLFEREIRLRHDAVPPALNIGILARVPITRTGLLHNIRWRTLLRRLEELPAVAVGCAGAEDGREMGFGYLGCDCS